MNNKIKTSLLTSILISTLSANELAHITVTSATKTEQSIKDITSNIDVITSAELEERHYSTVNEALNSIAGITVSQAGSTGQQTSFFLRGFDTESTLVLFNGVELNDPTTIGGQAQLEHLMISDIERIEIIKGAQSGIYGANASAGVINIITKTPTKELKINTSVEAGSFNTKKIGFSVSQKKDKLSYYLGAKRVMSDGITARATKGVDINSYEDDKYQNTTLNANISYKLSDKDTAKLKLSKINAKANHDSSISDQDGHTITQNNKYAKLSYLHNFNDKTSSKLYIGQADFLKKDPTGYTKRFEGENKEIGIDNTIKYNQNDLFLIGANKKESNDKENSRTIDSLGYYLTNSNSFKGLTGGKTTLTESLRYDKYSEFSNKTTGKIGLKHFHESIKDFTTSVNYGTAYKTPSLYEYNSVPTLTPESIKSFDVTFKYKNSSLTYFENKFKDELLYSSTTYKYYNSSKESKIKGWEFKYQNQIEENTLLNFDYTKFDAKDEDGYQLAKRPEEIANIKVDYYGIEKAHINLTAQYIGKRVEYTWGTHNVSANTGNYTVLNGIYNYELSIDKTLYVKVDNITDKYYQVVNGYATSPRAFYVGLNAKF